MCGLSVLTAGDARFSVLFVEGNPSEALPGSSYAQGLTGSVVTSYHGSGLQNKEGPGSLFKIVRYPTGGLKTPDQCLRQVLE